MSPQVDVRVFPSVDEAVSAAADIVGDFISGSEPTAGSEPIAGSPPGAGSSSSTVLGLAAGATVKPLYAELARRHNQSGQTESRANPTAKLRAYLLDEYVGLAPDDHRSFRNTLLCEFARPIGLAEEKLCGPRESVCGPRASEADLFAECARYEASVKEARVGIQLLGIGVNGHIGFNEPGSPLDSATRVVELSEKTRQANARVFAPDAVPTRAITQGIGTILAADKLLLLAFGSHKAAPVQQALEGEITPQVPASAVRLHSRATVILDTAAASKLSDQQSA